MLVAVSENVETETLGVEIQLVLSSGILDQLGNVPGIFNLAQLDITLGLLDCITNELRRAGFSLGSDDHSLLLLPSFVDHKCGTLSLLLSDLLGFDGGSELRRERQML